MNSYELQRPDRTASGVWVCGRCQRAWATTIGPSEAGSAENRNRAESCCVPRHCSFCTRQTERDVLGNYPPYHAECLAAALDPGPPHPSMADPWARLLYRRMSDISEDGYAAGWLIGNEFSLWAMLHGNARSYGQCTLSEHEIEELRVLAEKANGWIFTGGPDEHAPRLVAFDVWATIYADSLRYTGEETR